jgi:multiple sugar transport system ATP-binding protein
MPLGFTPYGHSFIIPNQMASISFKNLSKAFPDGTQALRGIDLEVKQGEFLALVGPSGCGKTTLLRILAGLEQQSAGSVFIDERDASTLQPRDRDLAMVFQNYALFPHLSVFDNLAFGLKARRRPKEEIKQAVLPVAERLGLSAMLKRKPNELSGGQRQRVALGRLLARNPSIHLLDEPLSNLDANLRASMRNELAQLHQEHQRTTLYVTHDQVEAMTLGKRICVMNEGEIIQVGTPTEIYDQPVHRFVAEFFGSPAINVLPGRTISDENGPSTFIMGEHSIDLPGTRTPEPGHVLLGLRPEDLTVAPNAKPDKAWETKITRVENLGDSRLLRLALGPHELSSRQEGHSFKVGDTLLVEPDWKRAHWFDPSSENRIGHNGDRDFVPPVESGHQSIREEYGYFVFDMPDANADTQTD